MTSNHRAITLVSWLLLAFVFAGFTLLSTLPGPLHGDEPHYLIITVSLLKDFDLNLENNYQNNDYKAFVPRRLTPHWGYYSHGKMYSFHDVGLSVLLALPYWMAGRTGCVWFMVLMGFLTAIQIPTVCSHLNIPRKYGLISMFLAVVNLPFLMMSGKIFPEIAGAFFLFTGFHLMFCNRNRGSQTLGCALLALLPWLHLKFAILSFLMFITYLVVKRPHWQKALVVAIPALLSALMLGGFQQSLFGDPFYLLRIKGGGFQSPFPGIFGLFLDREAGLLVYAPALALAFARLVTCWRRNMAMNGIAVMFLVILLISGSWIDWHSGHCPPARYLVPMIPFMGIFLADFIKDTSSRLILYLGVGCGLIASMQCVGIILTIPENAIVSGDGALGLFDYLPGTMKYLVPSFLNPVSGVAIRTVGWFLFIAGSVACLIWGVSDMRARKFARVVIVFLVGVTGLVLVMAGARDEAMQRDKEARTPLAKFGPEIIEPSKNLVFYGELPDLVWEAVPGADSYLWSLEYPDGTVYEVESYGKTQQLLPDSMAEALNDGKYCFRVVPLKRGKRGVPSDEVCFMLINRVSS